VPVPIGLFSPTVHPSAIEESARVMRSGWIGMGPEVAAFEREFAHYLGLSERSAAIAVNSCTNAMHLALRLLRLEPGAEIITTAMTFVATNQVLLWENLKPVFADIDPASGNISAASVAEKLSPRTGAIMAVHFAGEPCDLAVLGELARRAQVPLIEDCAHACGALHGGTPIGASCNWCAFSFGPTKALTTIDGGMLIVPARVAAQAREYRILGQSSDIFRRVREAGGSGRFWDYEVALVGRRYHMNDVNAAIGRAHLPLLDAANARRAALTARYDSLLAGIPGLRLLTRNPANRSADYMYVLLAEQRDRLAEALQKKGITVGVHYKPNTHFPIFEHADLPASEAFFGRTLSLPLHPELSDDDVAFVAGAIRGGW
jgi:perosamine synthetase